VLDLGAGIGGPARGLAVRYGARVTALDATGRFCRANEALCEATGLADRVEVIHADALAPPFRDGAFDLVWTQAVLQNIPDKARLFAEAHRLLRPAGRLALFEPVALADRPLHFPVPWADHPSDSFLVTADELRDSVEAAGFDVEVQNEGPAVLAEIQRVAADLPPARSNGLDLSLLMPNYEERMASLGRNIAEQRITLVQVVAVRR
jgi:SAM-dependent methyltransferase